MSRDVWRGGGGRETQSVTKERCSELLVSIDVQGCMEGGRETQSVTRERCSELLVSIDVQGGTEGVERLCQ